MDQWLLGGHQEGEEKRELGLRKEYKKENFGGYGDVSYLDCEDGFTSAKTSNCTP